MDAATVAEALRGYFAGFGVKIADDGENLFDNGALDSTGVVDLLAFLEERFELELEPDLITQENFQSITAVTRLIMSNFS
ncbi:phosphopantetheine-binding protein [Magnetofaba australis]|uniref:Putative Acyl carrier protein n=1 Tax=Magnetofaba australis IT-1 TaxID=1434232 RepID=A0A1Y2K826_9PROT|nr:phosphopantetheine-binding protein [Magnetofaba australis]OSM06162.1 putative Acyl carrier protein [Magnetofaba australis IT-1]